MAGRPQVPRQGNVATTVAVLVLASCLAAPALAASDPGILCDKNQRATLDIARHELSLASHEAGDGEIAEAVATTIDSVADDHLLKPRVEATAREVFDDGNSETDLEELLETDADDEPAVLRLRRMSDNKLVPVRRQMYRQDI